MFAVVAEEENLILERHLKRNGNKSTTLNILVAWRGRGSCYVSG